MLSRETYPLAIAYLWSAYSACGGVAVRNGIAAVLAILCALAMASGGAAAPHGRAIASLQAATGAAAAKPASGAPGSAPLSTRVVAYKIDAKLDAAAHTITATETLTYHNLTGQPQQDFPFHLYLNAFQPQSTWMAEQRLDSPEYKWKPEHRGAIRVTLDRSRRHGRRHQHHALHSAGRHQHRRPHSHADPAAEAGRAPVPTCNSRSPSKIKCHR